MNNIRLLIGMPVLAAGLVLATAGCGDSNVTEPSIDPSPVLILGDGQTEDSVAAILTRAGLDVQSAGPYWEFDGTGLSDASAVIFLCGASYEPVMPADVQLLLRDFVAAGGGLLTTEWILYNTAEEDAARHGDIAAIIPALYGGGYSDVAGAGVETYTRAATTHPLTANLPATFTTPEDWSYSLTSADPDPAKEARVIFTGSKSGAAVVVGRHGNGRTVHWNMGGEWVSDQIWIPEARQLLVNIATYISGQS